MKLNKLIALSLSAALSLTLLAGCGGGNSASGSAPASAAPASQAPAAEESKAPESAAPESAAPAAAFETVEKGKLTVATSPDFAPYEFYAIDESGNPHIAGFDMALAQYVADSLGLELQVVPMDFDGVLMSVQTKSVDLGMAGLSADPKRESIMDFSTIYYQGGQSFVTRTGNEGKFPNLESLDNPNLTVGAQTGSIQVDLANQYSASCDIIQLPKVTEIVGELITGKLDGAYIETAVAESYAKTYPELAIVVDVPYESEGSAIGVVKGNPELLSAVNKAVEAALADGSMAKFVAEANELAGGEIFEGLLENK